MRRVDKCVISNKTRRLSPVDIGIIKDDLRGTRLLFYSAVFGYHVYLWCCAVSHPSRTAPNSLVTDPQIPPCSIKSHRFVCYLTPSCIVSSFAQGRSWRKVQKESNSINQIGGSPRLDQEEKKNAAYDKTISPVVRGYFCQLNVEENIARHDGPPAPKKKNRRCFDLHNAIQINEKKTT
jgi:hypothetical protein